MEGEEPWFRPSALCSITHQSIKAFRRHRPPNRPPEGEQELVDPHPRGGGAPVPAGTDGRSADLAEHRPTPEEGSRKTRADGSQLAPPGPSPPAKSNYTGLFSNKENR